MVRPYFVLGNWKMNVTKSKIDELVEMLTSSVIDSSTEVVVACPSVYLDYVRKRLPKTIGIAAQNCYKTKSGAFTGQISPLMILDVDCAWVLLGHTECRHVFAETDELIGEKIKLAQEEGLKVIAYIGVSIDDSNSDNIKNMIIEQLSSVAKNVVDWQNMVLAYESMAATKSGQNVDAEDVQLIHAMMRQWIRYNVSDVAADSIRIVYGGSVNGSNYMTYLKKADIDGFVLGSASLKPEFMQIVNKKDENNNQISM